MSSTMSTRAVSAAKIISAVRLDARYCQFVAGFCDSSFDKSSPCVLTLPAHHPCLESTTTETILIIQTHVPKSESNQTKATVTRGESSIIPSTDTDNDPFYAGSHATAGNLDSESIYAGLDTKQQENPHSPDEPTVAGASAVDPQFDQPGGPGISIPLKDEPGPYWY